MVEIAIAIFIITILLGSILVPLTTQVEQRQESETQKMLEDIKEALIGHAIAKGYLPCPDATSAAAGVVPNDGVEDFDPGPAGTGLCLGALSGSAVPPLAGSTRRAVGNVPWVTLGLGASDPWGNRFRYAVDLEFSARSGTIGTPFSLASAANLGICTSAACTTRLTPDPATNPGDAAVAVILSHGKNGRSAINSITNAANPAATSVDELDNVSPATFTSRTITALAPDSANYFDDLVTWVGKYALFNRMVAAGKLP